MNKLSGIITIDRKSPAGFEPFLYPKRNEEDEELILGYAAGDNALGVLQARPVDGMLVIDRMYVTKSFRGIGIGTFLLNDVKRRAKKADMEGILASFSPDRMNEKDLADTEHFLEISGFEKSGETPAVSFSLRDLMAGPANPEAHEKNPNCISIRELNDDVLKMSQGILMQGGTLPPVSKTGHLRESVFYVENGRALGCILLDSFDENTGTIMISDLRSSGTNILISMLVYAAGLVSAHHPETTTLYASPVNNEMKKFIEYVTGGKMVTLSTLRTYVLMDY